MESAPRVSPSAWLCGARMHFATPPLKLGGLESLFYLKVHQSLKNHGVQGNGKAVFNDQESKARDGYQAMDDRMYRKEEETSGDPMNNRFFPRYHQE
ncbi:hypothetical protein HPP92_020948 [Vanilla planifolia]|uniref:Uncharacterized protein n=1 Tax=Vanilla planifolia TaxID=51239 RepID=A0A835PV38_VANPL|nr:hypothetical protein HPP92_021268 [Vanilla planifolia]KAG0462472.1 hypothetical protein HPP92_020948 [Vanilla planifolia]